MGESEAVCVDAVGRGGGSSAANRGWQYFDARSFHEDSSFRVSCWDGGVGGSNLGGGGGHSSPGYHDHSGHRHSRDGSYATKGHNHFHRHEHRHFHNGQRSLGEGWETRQGDGRVPAYNIRGGIFLLCLRMKAVDFSFNSFR